MRRKSIGLAAIGLAGVATAAAIPVQATTDHTSITDVSGDANGTDPRFAGGPAPADLQTGPVSIPALDITGATVGHGTVAVTLLQADPSMSQQLVITLATPTCDHVTIEWGSPYDGSVVSGCHGTQRAYAGLPTFNGNTLTFALPSPLPRWLSAGTKVSRLSVQTTGYVDFVLGALFPPGDYATGAVDTTL